MALLTGMTEDGREVPVQVDAAGRLVAEGLAGPPGPLGPDGPAGPAGNPSTFAGGTQTAPGLKLEGESSTGIFSAAAGSLGFALLGQLALLMSSQSGMRIPGALSVGNDYGDPGVDLSVSGSNGCLRVNAPLDGLASIQLVAPGAVMHEIETSGLDGSLRVRVNGIEFCSLSIDGILRLGNNTSGSQAMVQSANGLNIQGVPCYANSADAAANGLVAGDLYCVGDGQLHIV